MKKKFASVGLALVLALSLCLVMAVPAIAQGEVVFSNYIEASGDYDVWVDNSIPPEVIEEFITNPDGQWDVTDIRLSAYGAGILGGGGTAQVTISIYDNAAGTSIVEDWDTTFESLEIGDDFLLDVSGAGVTLDANTAYWLGLETTDGSIGWQQTTGGSHVFELTSTYEADTGTVADVTTIIEEDIIQISIDPTSFNFGSLRQGECSEPWPVTIVSTSNMDIVVSTSTESPFYTQSLSIGVGDIWTLVNGWSADIAEGGSLLANLKVCVPDPWPAGMEIGTIVFWAEEDTPTP